VAPRQILPLLPSTGDGLGLRVHRERHQYPAELCIPIHVRTGGQAYPGGAGQGSWTEQTINIYTLGVSKYLVKHRNKIQLNLSYQENKGGHSEDKSFWNLMFQVEIGI
jgi:hypothetical protein